MIKSSFRNLERDYAQGCHQIDRRIELKVTIVVGLIMGGLFGKGVFDLWRDGQLDSRS